MDENEKLRRQNEILREQNSRLVEGAKSLAAQVQELEQDKQKIEKEKAKLNEKLLRSQNELEALLRRNKKKKPKRRKRTELFPENLERKERVFDLSDEEKEGLVRIGEDIQETAHYRRPIVYIVRKVFPKYARPGDPDAGVKQAQRPPALISGDRYDTSIAAEIIAAKYSYHLPIYRQEDLFAASGLTLSRSSLLNIQEAAVRLIRPLAEHLASVVRSDHCIGSDDTGVSLLLPKDVPKIDEEDPKSGRVAEVIQAANAKGSKSVSAKMWAYRGVSVPINVFDFTVSRHRDGPDLFLIDHDYNGVLLGDCYGANTGIYMRSNGLVVHAACVSHARRKAEYALGNHKEHATYLLRRFGELYDIEDEGRNLTAEGRLALRQERSKPVWDEVRVYLETKMTNVLSGEKITEAKNYLLNQWCGLVKYLDDGRIPIDNNETEQLMKQVAVGRKNWLFIGSVAAGYRAADLMTLCSSAIRNDLDVCTYLKDVLDQLLSGSKDYESLRPDVWAQSHPDSIREYRQKERRERSARRDRQRLDRRLGKSET